MSKSIAAFMAKCRTQPGDEGSALQVKSDMLTMTASDNKIQLFDVNRTTCAKAKNKKDYNRDVAVELLNVVNARLAEGVIGADPTRASHCRKLLLNMLSPSTPDGPPIQSEEVREILNRLRTAIKYLKNPSQYNSTKGKERLHFLYQLFGELGSDDPMLPLIAKELDMTLSTLRSCADERKGHGFDFTLPPQQRASLAKTWIPVRYICLWTKWCCYRCCTCGELVLILPSFVLEL